MVVGGASRTSGGLGSVRLPLGATERDYCSGRRRNGVGVYCKLYEVKRGGGIDAQSGVIRGFFETRTR